MHTKFEETSRRYLSHNEQQTHCNRITCTYSAWEEKLQMGPKKKKKDCQRQTPKTFIMGCLLQSASNASQPVLALSMRLTGRAWLNCEASVSAKRAEIWNPTGATHNRCLQLDRKDMGVREIWKQKQEWSAKGEHGTDVRLCDGDDEDRSPLVN